MKSSAHDLEGKSPLPRQPYRCRASSLIALTSFLSPPLYAGIEQDLARKDKIFDQDFKKMQGHTHIEI